MMKFKRKKVQKYRGSKTHGCGSMKKRRGAGNRGGRGRAGSGKRGDCKKPRYWKEKPPKGFVPKNTTTIKPINLDAIQLTIDKHKKGKDQTYDLDLKKIGHNKLLGKGKIKSKVVITTPSASKKAIEKVKKAGGEVKITK